MTTLRAIPPEIIQKIAILSDPFDLLALSCTSKRYNAAINPPNHELPWRTIYLAQPLDDPRICYDILGFPSFPTIASEFDWRGALHRIMRAQKIIETPARWSEDRLVTLQTILHLITNIPRTRRPWDDVSQNLMWVEELLMESTTYLDVKLLRNEGSEEEDQLRARIHCHFGLTSADVEKRRITRSRAYVYDQRHYLQQMYFGPFKMAEDSGEDDGTTDHDAFHVRLIGRTVNWVHVQAMHHVMSTYLAKDKLEVFARRREKGKYREGEDELEDFEFIEYPMSLHSCQSFIADPGLDLGSDHDWAGVEGSEWVCILCNFDSTELSLYNRYGMYEIKAGPLDNSILERAHKLKKCIGIFKLEFRITSVHPDHPLRPTLYFSAKDPVYSRICGFVGCMDNGHIHWGLQAYDTFDQNNINFRLSGVQVGAVRSFYGAIGTWINTEGSGVGPFWLCKIGALEDQLDSDEVQSDSDSIGSD